MKMISLIKHRRNLFRFVITLGLLFYSQVNGEIHVVGSPDPVSAVESKDVVLPCHVEPQIDMDDLVLEWTKIKQNSSNNSLDNLDYVHIYRDGHEVLNLKMASFVGRTSLLDDSLKHGNMSLRISNLTLEDAGRYRCYIPTLDSQYQYTVITLVVAAETPPNKKNTQPNGTSATGGSPRRSSIGCLIIYIVVAVKMLI